MLQRLRVNVRPARHPRSCSILLPSPSLQLPACSTRQNIKTSASERESGGSSTASTKALEARRAAAVPNEGGSVHGSDQGLEAENWWSSLASRYKIVLACSISFIICNMVRKAWSFPATWDRQHFCMRPLIPPLDCTVRPTYNSGQGEYVCGNHSHGIRFRVVAVRLWTRAVKLLLRLHGLPAPLWWDWVPYLGFNPLNFYRIWSNCSCLTCLLPDLQAS